MSTELPTVTGRVEAMHDSADHTVSYADRDMLLTRFYGGEENGTMIQLTLGEQYVQLTKDQVIHLIAVLATAYAYSS